MLYPFFYFVLPEQYLKAAPHTFFSALHVGQNEVAELENRIVNRFPNISTIDVSQSAAVLGNIMAKLNFIVTVFAGFAVLAGVLILVGTVFATQVARTKEVVFYKILGAGSRFVIQVLMLENVILALLSGVSAIFIAQIAGWLVCRHLFDIQYSVNIFACLVLLGLTVCCVVGVGIASSVFVLYKKPVQFLREQG
jgi:putative ABC transport system permease protein